MDPSQGCPLRRGHLVGRGCEVTTTSFAFAGSKSFDENFEALLTELESVDKEMAAILRSSTAALAKVVRDGERDAIARAAFNTEIATALDALVAPADYAKCEGDLVPRGGFDFCPLPDYLGFGFRFIFTPLQAQRSDSGLLPRLGLT
jgi:hypothetical protein